MVVMMLFHALPSGNNDGSFNCAFGWPLTAFSPNVIMLQV